MVVSPAQAVDACGCDGETRGHREARVGMAMQGASVSVRSCHRTSLPHSLAHSKSH